MRTKRLPSFPSVILIGLLCLSFSSCNRCANKQFEVAMHCYEDRDCEEAIRHFSKIGKDSPHYEEAQELLEQSYRDLVNSFLDEYRYDEATSLLDTISENSCYFGISRLLLPYIQIKKIELFVRNTETKNLSDSTFEPYDKNVKMLQFMLDTIISDPKLLERKPNYQRVLSRAYAIESIYFVERQRFEEALRLLNKVDPTHVDTEGFSVEIYKQAIIGAINTINRQNDIYKIKTITSNITDADYFDSSHTSDNKYDLVD